MRRRIHVHFQAAVLLALVAAAGCATSGVNRGDVNVVSLEEEWQLGAQLEADIARQLPLVNDAAALSYLNQLGQALVNQSEMRNLPWEFHIVADPSINAFNIPGGHVYVHTGLIAAADNAAELAGVMAHEISHGVSRHATEQMTKSYGLNIGASILLGNNPAIYEQILASIVGTGAMARFSRNDEREADDLGISYMYNAGYDPIGMATMFEELLSERQQRPSALEQFFSTHPLTEDRINDVTAQAQALNRSGLRTNDSGFANFKTRLSGYANR
jgi:beta-barrel assembly-enhancing protease